MGSPMSRHSVLCRNSKAWCYVAIRRDARTTETKGATEVFCRDRKSLLRWTWYNGKKKEKKRPLGYGASHLGFV